MKKGIIIICLILTALVFIFYIYCPFFGNSYNLSEKQKYFSIIGSFSVLFTSIIGLLLGSFYYFDKLKNDELNFKKEKSRQKLSLLLQELINFDELVDQVINKQFKNRKTLDYIRNKISRSFEIIEILITQNKEILDLSDNDINKILEVNSFVDKSQTIMHSKYSEIIKISLYEIKDIYIEKIKDAKRVCFLKAE